MQEGLGSINVVMMVVCQSGGYVILCQDRARRLGSKNVVMEVLYPPDGYVIVCHDCARRDR